MIKILFFIIFLKLGVNFSQGLIVDPKSNDSIKSNQISLTLKELYYNDSFSFKKKTIKYQEILKVTEKYNLIDDETKVYINLFTHYSFANKLDSASSYYKMIKENYWNYVGDYNKEFVNMIHGGNLNFLSKNDSAISIYLSNIKEAKDTNMLFKNHQGLGGIYVKLRKYELALNQMKKALNLCGKSTPDNQHNLALIYHSLGIVHKKMNNLDSSFYYARISYETKKTPDNLISLGYHYLRDDFYDSIKAKKIVRELNFLIDDDSRYLYGVLYLNSFLFTEYKDYDSAVYWAERSLTVAKKSNITFQIEAAYSLLSTALLKDKGSLIDSLNRYQEKMLDDKVLSNTVNYETQYRTSEKEKELLIAQNKNLQIKTYIQLGLLLLLITSVLIFILVKYRGDRKNKQIKQLRKQALQLQMNPHFLFNTLNSINSFIIENDKDQARNYLTKFSKLMRLTLENSQHEFIEIEKEVAFLDNYLSLEQVRKQNFDFEINVSPDIMKLKIPTLLFQPLLENSVIHGFNDLTHRGKLTIIIKRNHKSIIVEVSDNGVGFEKAKQTRLKNSEHDPMATKILQERIHFYSKGLSQLYYSKGIEGFETKGTSVSFSLPIFN
jgi:hypothetical protein